MSAHELLLRLAGRLSDRQLWRFRDWLAADAVDAVARSLPLTLLRERVAITPEEYRLAVGALMSHGADAEKLNALAWVDEIAELDYTFSAESPEWVSMGDSVAVVLSAMLRGRPEVVEARSSWRRGRAAGSVSRVVLVTTTGDAPKLTGELQRVLRALGTYEPAVEVLPSGTELPRYHRAALAASEPLVAEGHLVPS
ncbi:hypothetical protein [Actinokineospora globicatena]|uniref:Uncharacterized protein n=1 Tax=Actinokineospora globicatena TaxID=103729 RepID=A0A9W6VDN7_9PSEU|nr:hypothetical protein [Actinokineospora globicatena]MCP2300997.1 hypothetical protein [Actinokineospora globicatena]GLW77372.1 hypothetical protein Aglo01_18540 [Actinokineospora globicatena]GLW84206.1 hypothetical protein Aglo02_18460 [Actinokineospora globicatena]GLW95481.1 hypothetical protein Aglo03_62970 [Actinokineospora globicatena]